MGAHNTDPTQSNRWIGWSAQFSGCLQAFSRSHQFSNLPDISEIVHGPLTQHLLQGDFASLLMPRGLVPHSFLGLE